MDWADKLTDDLFEQCGFNEELGDIRDYVACAKLFSDAFRRARDGDNFKRGVETGMRMLTAKDRKAVDKNCDWVAFTHAYNALRNYRMTEESMEKLRSERK